MTGRLVQREALGETDRAQMFALLEAHFDGVTRRQFDDDLGAKNWVVLVHSDVTLVGFSTILARHTHVAGEAINVICSGDTIVSPKAWGSAAFPREWIHAIYALRGQLPPGRLIWLLLTSGYRTYRFLPVFWKEFYPRVDQETPPLWRKLLNELASEQFGSMFNGLDGIVRLQNPQRLRGWLGQIPETRAADPNVAFFLRRNPGHADGDELVCISDLAPDNLTAAGRRVVYGTAR